MAQATVEIGSRRARARSRRGGWFAALAARWDQHRELRRWLSRNSQSIGRDTGCRC